LALCPSPCPRLWRYASEEPPDEPVTLASLIETLSSVDAAGALDTMRRCVDENDGLVDDRSILTTAEFNRLRYQRWLRAHDEHLEQ
jgi:hypothetical protein